MLNREPWVRRNSPELNRVDATSPFTVGNGSLAYSADVTGLQTLYQAYLSETPLCTMANWGWHTIPAPTETGGYTLADVRMDHYDFRGRDVTYAKTRFPDSETAYDWLRQNPHKCNLARVGLRLGGEDVRPDEVTRVRQRLELYEGLLVSDYCLRGEPCQVRTCCAPDADVLSFVIRTEWLKKGLSVDVDVPYGSPDITGSDWEAEASHTTCLDGCTITCRMDAFAYDIRLNAPGARVEQVAPHRVRITTEGGELCLTCAFGVPAMRETMAAREVEVAAAAWWRDFWRRGGMVDFSEATHPLAGELERRVVLSLYLLAVNSAGTMPPAETGLTCNSWYGKAHLEMHFWHMAWAPLWGHAELLKHSLPWYHAHLREARENAARNGYKGARWPKMVGDDAKDSPSPIAVLLVWQQPHILMMLELIRRAGQEEAFLREQWPLVRETADFMADFAMLDEADGYYHLEPPLIPVQESYAPEETRDPAFEAAYWAFGLDVAIRWAERLGQEVPEAWRRVRAGMTPPPVHGGLYIAHANRPDTFENVHVDHPSMLQCLGVLPGEGIDASIMRATLARVLECWDYESLWGWDFAVIAMTAARLGDTRLALEQLLLDTAKNTYVTSGNNRQATRADLPLYLPGNGSLLLAVAALAAGWEGGPDTPGFRPDEGWRVRWDGLVPYV